MGKKTGIVIVTAALLVAGAAVWRFALAGESAPPLEQALDESKARVEVSFDYARQDGRGSNQIAVWIADGNGKLVKTLFATNFTAGRGGWEYRKESLPKWVADSGIAAMGKVEIDAITRATPQSGVILCAWYGDDAGGKPVPKGSYTVMVEATLRGENRVLYQSEVQIGGDAIEKKAEPRFFGPGAAERGMLTNVVVKYIP